ncbi:MAG: hybrid sensor histidine kinase/response regulator, partial [Anaerolineae bacterium]|nr:hybrid sensor histidine kinase/response regulator [Anaerolineae bacterium]
MSISASVRERLLNSFRAELKEHIQTMTDGLLALEQQTVSDDERQAVLNNVFRAAHSLKGAARSVGTTTIEQLAHTLEDILDAMRQDSMELSAELFNTCYRALDVIQVVQAAYEGGSITPPSEALQVLLELQKFSTKSTSAAVAASQPVSPQTTAGPEQSGPDVPSPDPLPEVAPAKKEDEHSESGHLVIPGNPALEETIRIRVSKLDSLMGQLSELMVAKIRAEQRLIELRQLEQSMALWQKDWLAVRGAYSQVVRHNGRGLAAHENDIDRLVEYLGSSQEQLRDMNVYVSGLAREYANDTMHMSLVIDELEEEIKRVRMLPLNTITATFGRMVRDLAQRSGKEAILRIIGGETELDKRVLEQIKDPLIHLLRNAVDHGLETPEQRESKGKPRRGTISLQAEQLANDIVITVADDGSGLDFSAIRQAVIRHNPAIQIMSDADLKAMIFNEGISTSERVTDISGRGVGLDIVRRNIDALQGRIDVDSQPGAGVKFILKIPLTLSSSHGLLIQVAGERFAVPLNNIERIMEIGWDSITKLGGFDTIVYNEQTIPLTRMSNILELQPPEGEPPETGSLAVIVLASAERRMAFVVDSLVGEQEIVIKRLGNQLSRVAGIAGATIMGDGQIVLILNVSDLIKMALRAKQQVVTEPVRRNKETDVTPEASSQSSIRVSPHILIVDDSITTRTLEKNILEAAGYRVRLATDGQEAWEVIAAGE